MNKKTTVIVLIAVAVLIVALILAFGGGKGVTDEIYEIIPGQQNNYFSSDGKLVVVNQEGITQVDLSGTQTKIEEPFANPVYRQNKNYKLLYDQRGANVTVFRGNKKEYTIETDLPIITAKTNAVGYTAVATLETGYKGKLVVYDNSGLDVYKWQMGNSYIVDMDISSDCKRLAVASVVTTGKLTGCRLVMINLDKAEIIMDNTIENTLPMSVNFTKNNIAITVTDNGVYAVDRVGKNKWNYRYDDKILESYKLCENGATVMKFAGASNNNIIEMYDNHGKKCGEYVSNNEIIAMDANEKTVAVTDGHYVTFANWKGENKGFVKLENDVRQVVLIDNNNACAVCGNIVKTVNR
ncbi:MAG: hypothetical protein IJC06_00775 [Clostridia bacterium]|nr:hypothetical protein [Clostridia bacterium]